MTKIHVLSMYGGEYETSWEKNIAASLDNAAILSLKSEYESRLNIAMEAKSKVDIHMSQWWSATKVDAPIPRVTFPGRTNNHNGPATDDEKLWDDYVDKMRKHYLRAADEEQSVKESLNLTDQTIEDMKSLCDYYGFNIEEIELI